jgi:hypothetical protein
MSIKTLRKRIALVAVSALGAGLMTVASVAPASATSTLDANELLVKPIGSGNTPLTACATDTTSNVDSAVIPLSSPGLVLGTINTSNTATGYVSVTGPAVLSAVGASWTAVSQTLATSSAIATSTTLSSSAAPNDVTISPTAVGTVKVTYGAAVTSGAVDVITITVVDKCAGGTLSLGLSSLLVSTAAGATASAATFAARTSDDDAATVASGGLGYVRMRLSDGYGNELSALKVLQATAAGSNCVVNLTGAITSGSYSAGDGATDLAADSGRDDVVVVSQADSDVPAKCTVSVSYDGTLVGTKTLTFRGIPAKITVSDVTIGRTSGNGFYRVSVEDAAGNPLPGVAITASGSETNNAKAISSGLLTAVNGNTSAVTSSAAVSLGKTGPVNATNVAAAGSAGADLLPFFTCGATSGSAKVTVRATISAATASYLTSAPFDVACGGALATWTISMDKATYAPGEVATLTLTGKDSSGAPVSTFTSLADIAYAFGGMTAVTAPTIGDVFASGAGIKTYQFSVGTSEGSFVGTFKTTGSTDTAAKTVQYKVANPNAAVSTNEVLAAIVKLIATINKQIRQLQKQLRR